MRKMVFIVGAVLLCVSLGRSGDSPKKKYILVYLVPVRDYTRQYLMICGSGDNHCNDVYNYEERHEWFETLDQAMSEVNLNLNQSAPEGLVISTNGEPYHPPHSLVGIYEVKEIPIERLTIGTEVVRKQKTVEETVPKQVWRVKP